MAVETSADKKYAVVTGANKGIGFEICRQLALKGITVVLTARDENRGLAALEKLKGSGLTDNVIFHQLDVADRSSIANLACFIKDKFAKLDILVNNAGVGGHSLDSDALKSAIDAITRGAEISLNANQTYELAEECLQINYYGARWMTETFIPLLQISSSPRIVNVSSSMGKFKNITNEWAKGVLSDAENLTEDRVDEVVNEYLKDLKEGTLQAKHWPAFASAYTVSKAALNAYTGIVASRYPGFRVNAVCPGFVRTDINYNMGILTAEEGAESPVRLALVPNDGPSGLFFFRNEVSSFE